MSIVKYELWLDESGNFLNENEKTGNPSLVGGVLVPSSSANNFWPSELVSEIKAAYNLKTKYIHGTELYGNKYGEMAIELLQKSIHHNARPIIFENEERLNIVNSDTTYLNILAEGIIQLLQILAAEHDEFELSILAANRVKVDGMDERKETILIKDKEYKEKLAEKLVLGMARRTLTDIQKWKWSFELDSAKQNPRLMIADVVCHSWFVRNGKKFNDQQRKKLMSFYNPTYIFSVFEHATDAAIRRSLASGAIGDAFFEWLDAKSDFQNSINSNPKSTILRDINIDYDYYLRLIAQKLIQIPSFAQATQLSIVENQIESLISIERDFDRAECMLLLLKNEVSPLFEKIGITQVRFFFKVYIRLLQIGNHRGDLKLAEEQILISRSLIERLAGRWESVDEVLDFMILEGVHRLNTYDFHGAIILMNRLNHFIDSSFEIISISLLEDLSILSEEMKSVIKGKVIGTRLQARCFLIRKEPDQINLARNDSDSALTEFNVKEDLSRQYQYRAQVETEANQPEDALEWLAKAFEVTYHTYDDLGELLLAIKNADYINYIFGSMHYSRTLVAAYQNNELQLAERMYQEWNKLDFEQDLFKETIHEHPFQIILWKHAFYLAKTNRLKAAIKKYDQAISICNVDSERLTIRSIGIGILFEKASVLLSAGTKYSSDAKKAQKEAERHFREFMEEDLPEKMSAYFSEWEEILADMNKLSNEEQSNLLYKLSQTIPY